eukprot:746663-Hanusia_phi.AAC.2
MRVQSETQTGAAQALIDLNVGLRPAKFLLLLIPAAGEQGAARIRVQDGARVVPRSAGQHHLTHSLPSAFLPFSPLHPPHPCTCPDPNPCLVLILLPPLSLNPMFTGSSSPSSSFPT